MVHEYTRTHVSPSKLVLQSSGGPASIWRDKTGPEVTDTVARKVLHNDYGVLLSLLCYFGTTYTRTLRVHLAAPLLLLMLRWHGYQGAILVSSRIADSTILSTT